MKTSKFTIDDIVFFKNETRKQVVQGKIKYIQYYFEDDKIHYCIDGWCTFFKENELFSTLDEAIGNESPKTQLF